MDGKHCYYQTVVCFIIYYCYLELRNLYLPRIATENDLFSIQQQSAIYQWCIRHFWISSKLQSQRFVNLNSRQVQRSAPRMNQFGTNEFKKISCIIFAAMLGLSCLKKTKGNQKQEWEKQKIMI